jgi:hypothetical protein
VKDGIQGSHLLQNSTAVEQWDIFGDQQGGLDHGTQDVF